jgi:hypothetical protein
MIWMVGGAILASWLNKSFLSGSMPSALGGGDSKVVVERREGERIGSRGVLV